MSAPVIQFSFVDGELLIKSRSDAMRFRLRPTAVAEELPPNARRWRPFWPPLRLLRPASDPSAPAPADDAAVQKEAAFAAFRRQLAAEVATVVESFGSHQWALLVLLHQKPAAADLARTNPVLAYCLANSDQFRGTQPEAAAVQAVWYCSRKQRTILEWLGFPGTEAVVRLMRKIPPVAASPFMLRCLRNALRADPSVVTALGHLPRINATVIELVANGRLSPLVTPKLLHEVADAETDAGQPSCGDLILNSLIMLNELAPESPIGPFSRVSQVLRCHGEIEKEYLLYRRNRERAELAAREDLAAQEVLARARSRRADVARAKRSAAPPDPRQPPPFPPPPLPGTDHIVPITSSAELVAEGQIQGNCVATYEGLIRQRTTYVYRVLSPERATLSVVRSHDGCWRRSELRVRLNAKAQVQTTSSVDAWIGMHRTSV